MRGSRPALRPSTARRQGGLGHTDRPSGTLRASGAPGTTRTLASFDCGALFDALDARRRDGGLSWYELADELWRTVLGAQRTTR